MSAAAPRFPFFTGVWTASAPLVLWALHFAFCYVVPAVGCGAGPAGPAISPARLQFALAAGTVLALALGGWLLWRACRRAAAGGGDLMPKVGLGSAGLAWIAMLWNAVPLLLLPVCGRA